MRETCFPLKTLQGFTAFLGQSECSFFLLFKVSVLGMQKESFCLRSNFTLLFASFPLTSPFLKLRKRKKSMRDHWAHVLPPRTWLRSGYRIVLPEYERFHASWTRFLSPTWSKEQKDKNFVFEFRNGFGRRRFSFETSETLSGEAHDFLWIFFSKKKKKKKEEEEEEEEEKGFFSPTNKSKCFRSE